MTSPQFHSAALLVHPSWLRVAIRRAWRHLSFFCVSTKSVLLYVSIFSSASLALLFMYSILSSNSLPGLMCLLSHSRVKYCCAGHIHRCAVLFSRLIGGFIHFVILKVFSS